MQLTGKIAVVTGAGRGIGRAIAHRLASDGARIAVVSRSQTTSEATASEICQLFPGQATAYQIDVSDGAAVTDGAKKILADMGKIDILVNNAGVTRDGLTMKMSDEDWDTVLNTNLKGAFHMIKNLQRSILKQPDGRIINISSVIGLIGNAGQANYAASKAGLIGLSKSLAREFSGRGVTVNVVAPGFITTDMTDVLTQEQKSEIAKTIPLKKLGTIDDIANAVAFFAAPAARYITGQVLAVDGGMAM